MQSSGSTRTTTSPPFAAGDGARRLAGAPRPREPAGDLSRNLVMVDSGEGDRLLLAHHGRGSQRGPPRLLREGASPLPGHRDGAPRPLGRGDLAPGNGVGRRLLVDAVVQAARAGQYTAARLIVGGPDRGIGSGLLRPLRFSGRSRGQGAGVGTCGSTRSSPGSRPWRTKSRWCSGKGGADLAEWGQRRSSGRGRAGGVAGIDRGLNGQRARGSRGSIEHQGFRWCRPGRTASRGVLLGVPGARNTSRSNTN